MKHDEKGREIMDTTPVEVPLEFQRPLTMQEEIRRMVRQELSRAAEASGFETFEESDDFDVEDDDDLLFMSPYEIKEMAHDGPIESLDGIPGAVRTEEPSSREAREEGISSEGAARGEGEGASDAGPGAGSSGRAAGQEGGSEPN